MKSHTYFLGVKMSKILRQERRKELKRCHSQWGQSFCEFAIKIHTHLKFQLHTIKVQFIIGRKFRKNIVEHIKGNFKNIMILQKGIDPIVHCALSICGQKIRDAGTTRGQFLGEQI